MPATCFLYRWRVAGDHVHVDVSAGPDPEHRAKCGVLTFSYQEWEDLLAMLRPHRYVETTYAGSRASNEFEYDYGVQTRGDPTADNWTGDAAGLMSALAGAVESHGRYAIDAIAAGASVEGLAEAIDGDESGVS